MKRQKLPDIMHKITKIHESNKHKNKKRIRRESKAMATGYPCRCKGW